MNDNLQFLALNDQSLAYYVSIFNIDIEFGNLLPTLHDMVSFDGNCVYPTYFAHKVNINGILRKVTTHNLVTDEVASMPGYYPTMVIIHDHFARRHINVGRVRSYRG